MLLSAADRRDAARLIVHGTPIATVRAVYPGLDTEANDFKQLVELARASAMASERVDRGFLMAQAGALLQPADGKHVLDAKTRAQLLINMTK